MSALRVCTPLLLLFPLSAVAQVVAQGLAHVGGAQVQLAQDVAQDVTKDVTQVRKQEEVIQRVRAGTSGAAAAAP